MWVENTKTGKFKFVERYVDEMTGKTKKISIVLDKNNARTRKEAQLLLQQKINEISKSIDTVSMQQLVDLYLAHQKETVKMSTYKRNQGFCNTLARVLNPDLDVNKLNAGYIRRMLLSTGKGAGTLNEFLTRLKALLRWGYKNDYIKDISFLDKLDRFKDVPHKLKIQDKFLESDELKRLITGMQVQHWKDLTEFLSLSGLRVGEAVALNRSDIDLKERVIHVSKTFDPTNRIITTPKTLCSIRDVYMQDELYSLCKRLLTESKVVSIAEDYSFKTSENNHIEYYSYNKYLKKCSEEILGRKITPHALRHTHASLLLEQGASIDLISRRLGHENSKVTREIYLHVTEKLKQREHEQIKAIKIL